MDAFKDKVHEIEEGAKKQFDNLFHSMFFSYSFFYTLP